METSDTLVASHAGIVNTAERQDGGGLRGHHVVDGHATATQSASHAASTIRIGAPHRSRQTIWGVIGAVDDVLLVRELEHRNRRAEGFIRRGEGVIRNVRQNDWRNEARLTIPIEPRVLGSAAGHGILDMLGDLCDLEINRHVAEIVIAIIGIRLGQQLRLTNQLRDELIMNRLVDIQALNRGARLAGRRQRTEQSSGRRPLNVGVFENDHGILAAELQLHWNQQVRALLHDLLTRGSRTGEHDHIGVLINHGGAHIASAINNLNPIRGDRGFLKDGFQQALQRSMFRRLVDHRITRSQRRHDRHNRLEEWVVPRGNNESHAARLKPKLGLLAHHRQRRFHLLRGQYLLGILLVPRNDVQSTEHFGHQNVRTGLPRLRTHRVHDLLGAINNDATQILEVLEPLSHRQRRDSRLRFTSTLNDSLQLGKFRLRERDSRGLGLGITCACH